MQETQVNPAIEDNKDVVLNLLNTLPKHVGSKRKVLPDFLILGPPKTATTSLAKYIGQHPDIYMSPLKNPAFFIYEGQNRNFFGRNVVNTLDAYYALFQHHSNQKAIGEVSPGYLPDHSAPSRIFKHIPAAKMITILRNPVERAWSQFVYNRQIGIEQFNDFNKVIDIELDIIKGIPVDGNPKYIRAGFYYNHLTRYHNFFTPNQLLVILYDDFVKNPLNQMRRIFSFLNVDEEFIPDISTKYNITCQELATDNTIGELKIKSNGNVNLLNSGKTHKSELPPVPDIIKNKLLPIYAKDIISLQKLLGKNLGNWLV